jgi:peptidoglycan/LPS O-acetylase OafA/YrhL
MSPNDGVMSPFSVETTDVFTRLQQAVRGRMSALDGLRGIAIIWVVWHNSDGARAWDRHGILPSLVKLVANIGWVGVQLFFVLSGFLITGILLDQKGSPHQFRNFYVRRALRIFPLYYLMLTLLFIILPALGLAPAVGITNDVQQIWYWLFLANWSIPTIGGPGALSHFWSLAVEEQFYLLWPLAVFGLSRRALGWLCLLLIFSAFVMRVVLFSYGFEYAQWRSYEFTFVRWDALAIGALLALVVRSYSWHLRLQRVVVACIGAAVFYMLAFVVARHNYEPVGQGVAALNQTIAALLFAALLYQALAPCHALFGAWQRFLHNPVLRNAGKYSYAIYVFHYPVLMAMNSFLDGPKGRLQNEWPFLTMLLYVAAAWLISHLLAICSWRLIEQPCLRLKRFFVCTPARAVAADAA